MICISMKGKHNVSIQLHNNIQVISQINRLNQPCIVEIDKKTARSKQQTKKKIVLLFSSCQQQDALNILIIIMMMSSIILYRCDMPTTTLMNNDQLFCYHTNHGAKRFCTLTRICFVMSSAYFQLYMQLDFQRQQKQKASTQNKTKSINSDDLCKR